MGISSRLAIISQDIINIDRDKLAYEQNLTLQNLMNSLPSRNPGIRQDFILYLEGELSALENRKRALLQEQQALIVQAVTRGDRRN